MITRIVMFVILLTSILSCRDNTPNANNSVAEQEEGFEPIFDGKTLLHWEGDPGYWRVENGNLVGEITPHNLLKTNTFVIYAGEIPKDFELKMDFRITEDGNSGINYRSELLDTIPFALRGYQADIDGKNRYTGQNYEERKRTTLAYRGEKAEISSQVNPGTPGSLFTNIMNNAWQIRKVVDSLGNADSLRAKIRSGDWNEIHLIIRGNDLQHFINGVLMSEVIDNDSINRSYNGKLGMQVHVGPPMKVEYRNIRLKKL
ncbi:MAG: DUF1080 domain-containing protein [Maribacter sp.]|nr:DUF1080 domain-containing protein [Maribacter sp.]